MKEAIFGINDLIPVIQPAVRLFDTGTAGCINITISNSSNDTRDRFPHQALILP